MGVVDEKGRLFGVVNVIDLLVAVVVLATLVAGAAFVLTDDPVPPENRYVTVVLDDHPGGTVPTLDSDTAPMPTGAVSLDRIDGHVTDTYIAPRDAGGFVTVARVRVPVSAAVANETTDRRLVTEEGPLLVGQRVGLTAGEANYRGYIHTVGRSGEDLPVRSVDTRVVTRLPPAVAERVEPGDTQRVAGKRAARVTAVERTEMADGRVRVEATISLRVFETDEGLRYGTQHVRPGAEVTVAPGGYEFTATVTGAS